MMTTTKSTSTNVRLVIDVTRSCAERAAKWIVWIWNPVTNRRTATRVTALVSRRSSTTDAPSADPRIRGKLLNRVEFATCIEFETTYVVPMSTSSALSSRKPADLSRALQVSLQEAVRRLLACSSHSFARSWYLVVPHPPPVLVDEESGNPTSDVRRSYFNHGEIRLHRKTSCLPPTS